MENGYRKHLYRFDLDEQPDCSTYEKAAELAEHVFFTCLGFESSKRNLRADLTSLLRVENVESYILRLDAMRPTVVATMKRMFEWLR